MYTLWWGLHPFSDHYLKMFWPLAPNQELLTTVVPRMVLHDHQEEQRLQSANRLSTNRQKKKEILNDFPLLIFRAISVISLITFSETLAFLS